MPTSPRQIRHVTELHRVLMRRDEMSFAEADALIIVARALVAVGNEDPEEVLADMFGLEPDYVFDLLEPV